MSRIHGRSGALYLSLTSGAAASPLAFMSDWSVSFSQAYSDVTTLADTSRRWISSEPDISGSFTGWYDDATLQAYSAAADGLPRSFYLYPNISTPSRYFQGVVNITEFDVTSGVTAGAAVSGAWTTTGSVTLVAGNASGGIYAATYSAAY